jgi:hypothetical protein
MLGPSVFFQSFQLILFVFLASYFGDIILLIPTYFSIQFLIIDTLTYRTLLNLKQAIESRAKYFLTRKHGGYFWQEHMFIQISNPACRAARMYPKCSVSLLLMQTHDDDFRIVYPRYLPHQIFYWIYKFENFIQVGLNYIRF